MRKSLIRVIVVVPVFVICQLQSHLTRRDYLGNLSTQPRCLLYYVLIALVAAVCVTGPLFFLFNGGFTIKNDVIRFHFTPIKGSKPFYLEVEPANELNVREALLSAGLKLEKGEESQDEWECEACGATVDTTATKCPYCGAEFED